MMMDGISIDMEREMIIFEIVGVTMALFVLFVLFIRTVQWLSDVVPDRIKLIAIFVFIISLASFIVIISK